MVGEADVASDDAGPADELDASDVAGPTDDVTTDPVVPGDPELLAAHEEMPGIDAQNTARGKRIGSLFPYDGRLYVGYGDFDGNTGPIAVLSFGLTEGGFNADQVLPTEEILRWAVLDGVLYTADIDPDSHQGVGGAYRLDGADGTWETTAPIEEAVHTFDVAAFDGRLWAATGCSPGASARVASSSDLGETWDEEHATAAPDDGGFSRYNFFGPTPTRMFVSGRVHYELLDDAAPFSLVYTPVGDTWVEVSGGPSKDLLVPLVLGEAVWVAGFSGDPGKKGSQEGVWRLEGTELVSAELPPGIDELVHWYVDDAGTAWILASGGEHQSVWRAAPSGAAWNEVIQLPANADRAPFSAVGHADQRLFLGTREGDLWTVDGVVSD